MKDSFGREINYLRISITDRCNLRCRYCMPEGIQQVQMHEILSYEEILEIAKAAASLGITKIKVTGGEPLVRLGCADLVKRLKEIPGIEQVTMTTNGILLNEEKIAFFREHRPSLIQITLYGDSEDAYERVTGRRVFHTVIEHIQRVREEGFPLIITITPNHALGESVFETIRLARSITRNMFINTSLFDTPDEPLRQNAGKDPDVEFYARILRFQKELNGITIEDRQESELPLPGGPCKGCTEHGLQCGGGRSGFVVNWKGEMKTCNRLAPKTFPLRDGFQAAWRELHETAMNWPRASECRDCAYEQICGICAAEALKYAEPGKQPKALCERTRYLASRGVLPLPCFE